MNITTMGQAGSTGDDLTPCFSDFQTACILPTVPARNVQLFQHERQLFSDVLGLMTSGKPDVLDSVS